MAWPDVRQNTALTVRLVPHDEVRYTTPTGSVLTPAGLALTAPTVTLDTVSTTVSSATDERTLVVASATGLAVGRRYLYTRKGQGTLIEIRELSGTTVTLVDELPAVPVSGETIQGIELAVAITTTHTATRGTGFRLVLRDTDDAGRESVHRFYVVRQPWASPLSGGDVARYIQRQWSASTLDPAEARDIARRVGERLRDRILASETYPHLYYDAETWREASYATLKVELAERGRVPRNWDTQAYTESVSDEAADAVSRAVRASTSDRDSDDDHSTEDETRAGMRGVTYLL